MTLPTLVVEAAFGYAPLDASPSWTAITSRVRSIRIDRGRSSTRSDFQPGVAQIVLRNHDRLFDPLYSSGSYYGNLKPNVPIRVTANGTTVFRGFVDAWPQSYRPPRDAECRITCFDGLKLLAQFELEGVYESVITADTPVHWWPLNETSGLRAVDRGSGRNDGDISFLATPGGDTFPILGPALATNGEVWSSMYASAAYPQTGSLTVEAWFRGTFPDSGAGAGDIVTVADGDDYRSIGVTWAATENGDTLQLIYDVGGNRVPVSPATMTLLDGNVHHVAFTSDFDVYLDGVLRTDEAIGGAALSDFVGTFVGDGFPGAISHVAVYDVVLSASDIAAHYAAGTAPWDGQLTGARVTAVLDAVGWPAGLRSIDTGTVTLGPLPLETVSPLQHLQLVAATEGGRFFIDAAGNACFHDSAHDYSLSSQLTFSDDGSDSKYDPEGLELIEDVEAIVNEVRASGPGGTGDAADSTSITAYGRRSQQIQGLWRSSVEARNYAEGVVFRGKDPRTRVSKWSLQPEAQSSWASILGLEIGERVQFEITPQKVGSQIVLPLILQSIGHDYTGKRWEVSYWGSLTDPNSYWTWGTSTWGTSTKWR